MDEDTITDIKHLVKWNRSDIVSCRNDRHEHW